MCALGPDHDLTTANTSTDLERTWSWSANSVLLTHRAKHTLRSSGSCTGIVDSAAGHSIFKFRKKKNARGRCLAIQHNLVLVSLLLTYHLTICNDPRQLLSSRRTFRQRSAKPDLAHSYNPYHSCWANTETKPATLPFVDKMRYLEVLPERKCWFSTESQVGRHELIAAFSNVKTFLRCSGLSQKQC